MKRTIAIMMAASMLAACGEPAENNGTTATEPTDDVAGNVLSLAIEGWSFVGPSSISSGWTNVRVNNDSGMIHHALVYRLPDGVSDMMVADQVIKPIQESLTARLAGDQEKANQILGTIPPWIAEIVYLGGPGMISDGVIGDATMYLEPGNYIVECYVKTNGMQHNYNPEQGMHGMVMPFVVTPEAGGMAEPTSNVTLQVTNDGYEIVAGAFKSGQNVVQVDYVEQRLYNNFVGHDAHIFKIDPETDIDGVTDWMNPFADQGQETPAPALFVGGLHDMPHGTTGYFTLDLEPGDYGIVAEIPGAREAGFFKTFSVTTD